MNHDHQEPTMNAISENPVEIYRIRRAWLRAAIATAIDAMHRELPPDKFGYRAFCVHSFRFSTSADGVRIREDAWTMPLEPGPVPIAACERVGLDMPASIAPDYRDRPLQRVRLGSQGENPQISSPSAEDVSAYLQRLRNPVDDEATRWLDFFVHIALLWHAYVHLRPQFLPRDQPAEIAGSLPWLGRLVAVHHNPGGLNSSFPRCPIKLTKTA